MSFVNRWFDEGILFSLTVFRRIVGEILSSCLFCVIKYVVELKISLKACFCHFQLVNLMVNYFFYFCCRLDS